MPVTPQRAKRAPAPGARFPSQVLAENARISRAIRRLSQDEVARRMTSLGYRWVRNTVSEVERGLRNVSIDELFALAMVLSATIPDLLDPGRWDRPDGDDALDVGDMPGGEAFVVSREWAGFWVRDKAAFMLDDDGRAAVIESRSTDAVTRILDEIPGTTVRRPGDEETDR